MAPRTNTLLQPVENRSNDLPASLLCRPVVLHRSLIEVLFVVERRNSVALVDRQTL